MWSGHDKQTFLYRFRGPKLPAESRVQKEALKMIDTSQNQEIEFAAFVGIDWADRRHAWALQIPGHLEVECGELSHTGSGRGLGG